jgi:predicted house-cleaning noncanonical NTP pyrophosphatase (MazG superfamily)
MEKKKPKVNINLESLFIGDEPTFDDPKTDIGIIRSLSWYSNQYGPKESKKYTLEYTKQNKYAKDIQTKLSSANEELFTNLGFVCRMISRGANFGSEKVDWIDERIHDIITFSPDTFVSSITTQKVDVQSKPEKTIQERVFEQATFYINEIEGHVDNFIKNRTASFKCYDWFKSNDIKPIYMSHIKTHYQPLHEELSIALDKSDEQIAESYSHWTKKELRSFLEFISQIIMDCDAYSGTTKAIRKPRKKKAVPLEKKVASVKYQKESVEYKIASISPTEIIGAQQLWVFNTKYKQLGWYKAEDESGFGIKGTTIIGFNEYTSVGKKLRKPLEMLDDFKKAKKSELKKFLQTLTTTESKLSGRINSDTILLKVIK